MTDQMFASVWEAIESTPAQAENMKLRSSLMMAVSEHIKAKGLSQAQAARVFGVTQPRVSDLIRGKINLFSIDTLVAMLSAGGLKVEMKIHLPRVGSGKVSPQVKVRRRISSASRPVRNRSAA